MSTPKVQRSFHRIDNLVEHWIECGHFPGASLVVRNRNELLCESYWGTHKPETVEFVASAGKWLAAAALLSLVDSGHLGLQDPVRHWIPDWTDGKGEATLAQLLSHTSGYPAYQPPGLEADKYQSLSESVAHIAPLPLLAPPGTTWNYGGLSMQVAGRLAELATGKDWETVFQERIAHPLGMQDTGFTPVDTRPGHHPMLGGGARSSARDYIQFLNMIADYGVFNSRQILKASSVAALEADHSRQAHIQSDNFVARVRGSTHRGIYGLGLWRERVADDDGRAILLSSPSWAGTYPWVDREMGVHGFFLAHVSPEPESSSSPFDAMAAAAQLPDMVARCLA